MAVLPSFAHRFRHHRSFTLNTHARLRLAAALAVIGFAVPVFAQENNEPPQGFKALFNGKDLSGWYGMPHFDPRTTPARTTRNSTPTGAWKTATW
jgi:hypothetical protein